MPIHVDAGRSTLPRQSIHRAADVYERVDELEVQSAVTRWVRNALTNRELEQPADAVEVGVKARDFAEGLGVHSALEACDAEARAQHFATGTARLSSKGIEACEVVLVDAKGHHSGFRFSGSDRVASDADASHGLTSRTASQAFRYRHVPMQSADTRVPQTKQGPRLGTRPLAFPVTPTMQSWNQLSVFIEVWEGLRRIVAQQGSSPLPKAPLP